ncbi:hypothetical protein [Rhodococcus opacus]|uniref:hypothetical protein n=1 Tax=Rhodococcus opacus TaxID=37919 RepID=UPI001F57EC48|nr:hypothetical protein [Rhodococcus opacus]UNN05256.1 hypothetical protein MOO23_40270 [Rhodococcus opacus]UOT08458.1 hypothetical protein MPY17_40065 [Rhodococcus opacus]
MVEMSPRKPGRPSLGERKQLKVRVIPEIKDAAKRAAHSHGMTETQYITALIAADTGLTNLVTPIQQEELPHTA